MAVGISLLCAPIWSLFYKVSTFGFTILMLSIFTAILTNAFVVTSSVLQGLNKFKTVYLSTISGFATNALLDIPLMLLFNYWHWPAYYGAIVATMIGYTLTIFITLYTLHKQEKLEYKETFRLVLKSFVPLIAMILVVICLKLLIPLNIGSKLSCILYVGFIAIIGAASYLIIAYKINLLQEVFGQEFLNKIIKKLTLGRVKLN